MLNKHEKNKMKTMTIKEYIELLSYIDKNHSFREQKGKCIKYVNSTVDMRTGTIFYVEFKMFFPLTKEFHVADIPKDKTLKQWIYEWLDKKEEKENVE